MSDDRLREEFARLAEIRKDGRDCPAPDTLRSSARGELAADELERVVLHIGECTACATAWRIAHDLAGDASVTPFRASRTAPRQLIWVPLAAAASLLFALVGGSFLLRDRVPTPTYRTQQTEGFRPAVTEGASLGRDDFVLAWTAGPEGMTYDIRVTTEDLRVIARGRRLEVAEFRVDASDLSDLPSGVRIFWQVTARYPDGRVHDSESFSVVLD